MILNMRDFGKLTLIIGSLLFGGAAGAAAAQDAAAAGSKPILTVSGQITPSDGGNVVQFDRASFESLGMVTIETKTPWYPGPVKFEGVPLDKLMLAVGAKGKTITVVALNDYSSDIPVDDFTKYHPILAIKRNGEYMPVTDKGPLFVIYPFDSNPDLQSQQFYSRSVWQVAKLIVN